jgi:hypothetical protein
MSRIDLRRAGACPGSNAARRHEWRAGELADLVTYGQPDHGVTVRLGHCGRCGVPLLRVEPLSDDTPAKGAFFEAKGAEL